MMKNEMEARCKLINVAVPPKKQVAERLGLYDVDVDQGDMSAAARFLDKTPVPVADPRLVRPSYQGS